MANERIRQAAKAANIPLWQLADALAVSEATMTRMLRRPLPPQREAELLALVHAKEVNAIDE